MSDLGLNLDELRDELSDFVQPVKKVGRTPLEERVIAGFEDIQRFVEKHGRAPLHGEDNDIFERLYAVRLDQLRAQIDCRALLAPLDHQGLLDSEMPVSEEEWLDTDTLMAELEGAAGTPDITELRHVRGTAEKRAAEEIANRERCDDFDRFKPLFDQIQTDLDSGDRQTRPFVKDSGFLKADIGEGQFFILGGQVVYVAEVGECFRAPNGETDARLRLIYSNGTESNLLLRSLQRALYKDEAGRRITEPEAGPLFVREDSDNYAGEVESSGTIYVLRSCSDDPFVAANRDILHKIGVTGGDVARRIGNAKLDPTYLMADVEIVATYTLYSINRTKLENLLHRIFEPAKLKIELKDRLNNPIIPREWFLVPRFVIDEAVERIRDGTITNYHYEPTSASLIADD